MNEHHNLMGEHMNITPTTTSRWAAVLLPLLLIPALLWWWWPSPRDVVYSLYRERGRTRTIAGLSGYQVKSGKNVDVYYTEADQNVVDWVVQTTDAVYGSVTGQVGFAPSKKVPVVNYPTRDELRHAFGWGNGESAMGVYWSGTIRLLSPNVWIKERGEKEKRKVFDRINPIAHELTHYVLDYMTNGNYPRWFTEGLAQRVEYKTTGYLWIESESTLHQTLYTLDDLEKRYDQLQNQPLAYRQSFLLVDHMARTYGEEGLSDLIQRLGQGIPFATAVEQVCGEPLNAVYGDWLVWVRNNLTHLDPAS